MEDLLEAVLRGDVDVAVFLAMIGAHPDQARITLPSLRRVVFPLGDLAQGLVAYWGKGARLRAWATTILAIDAIEVQDTAIGERDRLLGALRSASAGEPLDEYVRVIAERRAGRFVDPS